MKSLRLDKNKNMGVITVLIAFLTALSSLAIDSFLSGMPLMAQFFGVEINTIELIITLYFLGFAVGNFFGGPLSDAFGRKKIALAGIGLYGFSALSIPFCDTIEMVLVLRFFQAFGGGFATVTANLFIRDWYQGKQVARLITITAMIMMLVPLFAPVLGGFLINLQGWKLVFYFLFAMSVVLFIIFYLLIPESRDKASITNKITAKQLVAKYKILLSDKKAVIFLFALCFPVSGLYVFITSASFIYLEYFNVEVSVFPLIFATSIILNVLASFSNTYLLRVYEAKKLFQLGITIQLISGFSLFVITLLDLVTFWNVFILIALFIGSIGFIFGNGSAILLDIKPEVSGAANAAIGITRFVLGFLAGTLVAIFHTNDLVPIGIGMFVCSLIGNIIFLVFKSVSNKSVLFASSCN